MNNNIEFEKEITVEVDCNLDELKQILKENNFILKQEYDILDIYMLKDESNQKKEPLDILNNCLLIRNIITDSKNIKRITYKYKEFNEKNEIIKQGKTYCDVNSIQEARNLLEVIGYHEFVKINDHLMIYANEKTEFAVQLVNDKHIYIELEDKCNYIERKYESIDEMINDFKQYNIPIKQDNYFVKKAEIEIIESNS